MKFTDRFLKLPVHFKKEDGSLFESYIKILPGDIVGWFPISEDVERLKTCVTISSMGRQFVLYDVAEFEKIVNEFVGTPVTDSEKSIALQQRLLDKLNEP